jgi:hypothetical protein
MTKTPTTPAGRTHLLLTIQEAADELRISDKHPAAVHWDGEQSADALPGVASKSLSAGAASVLLHGPQPPGVVDLRPVRFPAPGGPASSQPIGGDVSVGPSGRSRGRSLVRDSMNRSSASRVTRVRARRPVPTSQGAISPSWIRRYTDLDGGPKQLRGSWLRRDEATAPVFVLEWGSKQVDLSIDDLDKLQDLFQHLSWRGVMNVDAAICNAIDDHKAGLPARGEKSPGAAA